MYLEKLKEPLCIRSSKQEKDNDSSHSILILSDYKDAVRRSAEGDGSPVASPPKAEVESVATMTAKPSARLRRGEILLPHTKEMICKPSPRIPIFV